jgi:DNA (cytosine-5)-methyltransferase 1
VWWNLPLPEPRKIQLRDLVEENPASVPGHTHEETSRLLSMMSPANLGKVTAARQCGTPLVGTMYKRTRHDEHGRRIQRAEVRFDGVAGCLRTPAGGSSRQVICVVRENEIRSRLISSRETARLMGLPDWYILPDNYNEAYHLTGDGVAVPVVRFLAANLLEPILAEAGRK